MWVELKWLGFATLAALACGYIFEHSAWFLLLVAVIFLVWHMLQLRRLQQLLIRSHKNHNFQQGIWPQIFTVVRCLQNQNCGRKNRLSRFITQFREVSTGIPDSIILLDWDGVINWCNPVTTQLLGFERKALIGHKLADLLLQPLLTEYLAGDNLDRPLDFVAPSNKAVVLSLRHTPVVQHKKRLVIIRDITQTYYLEQSKRDFVANVSHELKTPLTVIIGYLETFLDMPIEPGWIRSLRSMQQQAQRMQSTIEDLLTLSCLEGCDNRGSEQPIPAGALLESIVAEVRVVSAKSRHVLDLVVDNGIWLEANKLELHSLFSNLIINAIRHTPDRTEITIYWHRDDVGVCFVVADTGEGIASRHIPRLTERFYRVNAVNSQHTGGSGLGLAIVKSILERLGGELRITSEVGKGAAFSCYFPDSKIVTKAQVIEN